MLTTTCTVHIAKQHISGQKLVQFPLFLPPSKAFDLEFLRFCLFLWKNTIQG